MRTQLSFCLGIACLLAVVPARAFAQTAAEARKSYDAAIQQAKRDFLKCDADALAAGVTEDYTGINLQGVVTKGRAAELKNQRELCAANAVTAWDVTTTDFHSSGPLAWAAGTMTMTLKSKASGKSQSYDVHYLATYVHQPDGKWLQQYFMIAPMAAAKK